MAAGHTPLSDNRTQVKTTAAHLIRPKSIIIGIVIIFILISILLILFKPWQTKIFLPVQKSNEQAFKTKQAIPKTNPFEVKTNPFKDVKTNPFR